VATKPFHLALLILILILILLLIPLGKKAENYFIENISYTIYYYLKEIAMAYQAILLPPLTFLSSRFLSPLAAFNSILLKLTQGQLKLIPSSEPTPVELLKISSPFFARLVTPIKQLGRAKNKFFFSSQLRLIALQNKPLRRPLIYNAALYLGVNLCLLSIYSSAFFPGRLLSWKATNQIEEKNKRKIIQSGGSDEK